MSPNIPSSGPETQKTASEKAEYDLEKMDVLLQSKNERDYLKVKMEALKVIADMKKAENDPNGADQVKACSERFAELYREAVKLRAELIPHTLRDTMGLAPNADISDTFTKGIDDAMEVKDPTDEQISQPTEVMTQEMKNIAGALAFEPTDLLENADAQNRYWALQNGIPTVNLVTVANDEAYLKNIEKELAPHHKELLPMIEKLLKGLEALKAVDPVRTELFQWRQTNAPRKMNMKPLRMLGILGGSLITAFGLYQVLYKKQKLTWPTFMWAAVAAYSLYPDMFQGKEKASIIAYKKYNVQGNKEIIRKLTKETYQELLDAPREEVLALRRKAASPLPITLSDIGTLTDGRTTALTKLFLKPKNNPGDPDEVIDKEKIIEIIDLVRNASKVDQEVIAEMIANR